MIDEEYRSFIILKGTILFVNTYGILHNPCDFDNPNTFNPDWHLLNEYGVKEGTDSSLFHNNISFGYGRRSCPGIHLAENSLSLNTMNLIWAFDFKTARIAWEMRYPLALITMRRMYAM
ncbi:cytochrome p450 [Moniliophthora roreri MCA 2997]|uniref:Cytochrome p450 n=1 Tax=Moniliophthora roreri (strain MCA 2997) TaxID=1381753 RepID=V2XNQ0_MONRO|nr:cytochrome p450 [Moniliophthora roreri MCA 2997]